MARITLLTGGVRSGKSSLAVEIGRRHHGQVIVLATAEPFDDEMRERIQRHRAERPGWPVVEAPVELAAAVRQADGDALLIVDCLTVWVNNLMYHGRPIDGSELVEALRARPGPAVVITNEVGLGVVPEHPLGRAYTDELGRLNQIVATAAARTLLLCAGRAIALADPWELLDVAP